MRAPVNSRLRILAALGAITLCVRSPFALADAQPPPAGTQDDAPSLEFGRPCPNPLPGIDPKNPVEKLNRRAPRSDPAHPIGEVPYPHNAREIGQEGTAVVALLVNEKGEVSQAQIKRSTGYPLLDNAALEDARNWHLLPGTEGGKPKCMWGQIAVSFRLVEYTDAELTNVSVSPEAQSLAATMLGFDEFDSGLGKSVDLTSTERVLAATVKHAFLADAVWLQSQRRIAAILSIEFTVPEIKEITEFQAKPVARKLRGLRNKFDDSIGAEVRAAGQTFACVTGSLNEALKSRSAADVFEGEQLKQELALRVPKFLSQAAGHCSCLVQRMEQEARGFIVAPASACGQAPVLE
ncbi:MAG: energy transducer TonB [Steroidobacteraceae bacterium]